MAFSCNLFSLVKGQLKTVVQNIKDIANTFFPSGKVVDIVDNKIAHLTATLPYPFNEELQGIANSSGIPLGNSFQHFINKFRLI
ncbi:acid ceramidase [Limosa lapponica baueri]|uniref:Acid ceramidase n=1 Tax=Limosa lapponica baueri TaxID=1758121 RepID=A0A2I0T6T2_LIMLA|nr:acid ceramidase [Limosa lapponica baueri]